MRALLEASDLTVRRGRRDVLRDVEFALQAGSAVHLAGANGSGKTSLLRVLAGLAAPRAGTLRRRGAAAFVPDRILLVPALRCREWLEAMRGLRGLQPTDWALAVAAGGLDPGVLEYPSARLSKGMLQRVALVEALEAGCPLLLLDEPFSSLDAASRDWLAGELAARAAEGAGILFTDHSGAAGDRLAPARVLELRDGRCRARDGAAGPRVVIAAVHPDGRRLRRAVAPAAGDGLLRELLGDGWHIEGVTREDGAGARRVEVVTPEEADVESAPSGGGDGRRRVEPAPSGGGDAGRRVEPAPPEGGGGARRVDPAPPEERA